MRRKVLRLVLPATLLPLVVGLAVAVFVCSAVVFAQEAAGVASGGGGWTVWGIISGILVPLLGALSGFLGTKWRNVVAFLIELAEAIVALGLALLAVGKFMEHPEEYSEEDRKLIWQKVLDVLTEFNQAIEAGTSLWRKKTHVYS